MNKCSHLVTIKRLVKLIHSLIKREKNLEKAVKLGSPKKSAKKTQPNKRDVKPKVNAERILNAVK